ncbi:MAG: tripartite tricarboxylate transporter TctB family protein [SAR324 cluster bacterium]|nr:tripartite tricarboxylate transporter TctB family protein [SAR324 cluster bacterium]
MSEFKHDRRYAIVMLVFSILYGYGGSFAETDFYNGVVGPHHWIYLIAGILACLSIMLFLKPSNYKPKSLPWSTWNKRIPLLVGVFLYSVILPYIGFLGAMIPLMVLTSMLFGAKFKFALLSSVIMTVLCLILFDGLLDISLGRGLWLM